MKILSNTIVQHDFWRITEDWSNDAENSALHHGNKIHFKIYSNRKQLFYIAILHNSIVFAVFFIK